MSELLTLFRTRPRNPSAGSLALGTLRSPASSQLNGLQVYYSLEETSGLRFDRIGDGSGPSALLVRTLSHRLTIADNASLSTGDIDFTFGGWFYKNSSPGAEMYLGGKFAVTGNQREYTIFFTSAGMLRFLVSPDGTASTVVSAGTPSDSAWHFVLGWHDATTNLIWIQLDNGTPVSAAHAGGAFDSTQQFALGVRDVSTSAFDGRMSGWFMSKRIYSAEERTRIYNYGLGLRYAQLETSLTTSMEAWWDLSELSGTRSDSKGTNHLTASAVTLLCAQGLTGNTLTDVNTVTSNTGIVGTAAEFTIANSEQLAGGDSTELRMGDADCEFAGWVYFAAVATNQTIFSKDNGAAAGREYRLDMLTATAKMTATIYDGTNIIGTVVSTGTFLANVFYYIRMYHDSVNDLIGLQVDGGTPDTAATTGAPSSGTSTPFRIGANGSASPQFFGGRIDELGKWNRIRTAGEVAAAYAAGSGLAFPLGGSSVL